MKIALVGDIHGDPRIVSSKKWTDSKDFTKDDLVIFLGDFGLFWNTPMSKEEKYYLDWLSEKPFQVAFVDGNHENFDLIEKLPTRIKWGGEVGFYEASAGRIYHLKRGYVYNMGDKKFFVMGGALSIDKHMRSQGMSWWSQEAHTKEEETRAMDNLEWEDWEVDYVLTHTCPDSVIPAFIDGTFGYQKIRDPNSRFFEFIANRLNFKEWHFGHFHNDRTFTDPEGDTYFCHYNKIHILD